MSRAVCCKTIKGRKYACWLLVLCIIFLLFCSTSLWTGLKQWWMVLVVGFVGMIGSVVGRVLLNRSIELCKTCFGNTIKIIFPIDCGSRTFPFTGKSSRNLQDILLTIDTEVPVEEEFRVVENKAHQFCNDLKTELESKITPTTTFECFVVGSAAERYGIPYAYMKSKIPDFIRGLKTDIDVMFCMQSIEASFDGRTGILIEPLTVPRRFIGFVQLNSLATKTIISSKNVIKQALSAVGSTKVASLATGSWKMIIILSKGPAIEISIPLKYEADITLCIKCCEWPALSDWPTRQRCWPSPQDVKRIVSLGCHLVPKSSPFDKEQTSWRFSFSVAELELSKLVPTTARKCFLALRIILKDHLQPILYITSYHIKTIFLNTLEKTPTDLWVDENVEQCFFILLKEVYDALLHGRLLHHWFPSINLFTKFHSPRAVQALIKKIQRIGENPAPFIFDDGCWCLLPCCTRLRLYDFPDSYDEVLRAVRVNEQVDDRTDQDASCDHDNLSALPVTLPSRHDAQLTQTSPSSSANHREHYQGSVQSVVVTIHSAGRQPTYDDDDRQPTYDHDGRQPTYDHDERQPILESRACLLSKYGAITI